MRAVIKMRILPLHPYASRRVFVIQVKQMFSDPEPRGGYPEGDGAVFTEVNPYTGYSGQETQSRSHT